jgi:hypothetical protein
VVPASGVTESVSPIRLADREGLNASGSYESISSFTTGAGECSDSNGKCTLKLSVIRPIITKEGNVIPYLEYKIEMLGANRPLLDRFIRVASRGTAAGFRRDVEMKIPQSTAIQGLDVTVFN